MFECSIELLSYLNPSEPGYYVSAIYNFDPGLQDGDEAWIYWEVWGTAYDIKVKVVQRKKEIYPRGSHPRQSNDALFRLRIFVEAEDRDMMIVIRDAIEENARMLASSQ